MYLTEVGASLARALIKIVGPEFEVAMHSLEANLKGFLPTIPISMPEYNISQSRPLSEITDDPIPSAKDIARRNHAVPSDRQQWFQNFLRLAATASNSGLLPWRFRMLDGRAYQLDQGAVGHAIANSAVELPSDMGQPLNYIKLLHFRPTLCGEIARRRSYGLISARPDQRRFSRTIRANYEGVCALTGCATSHALQAAHIATVNGADDNQESNGIFLRADIHALFDAFLFTFTADGNNLEVCEDLRDQSYDFLRECEVRLPTRGARPSQRSIEQHRRWFSRHGQKGKM